jgi:hypothetical protein
MHEMLAGGAQPSKGNLYMGKQTQKEIIFIIDIILSNHSQIISAGADGGPPSRVSARLTLRLASHRHHRQNVGACA